MQLLDDLASVPTGSHTPAELCDHLRRARDAATPGWQIPIATAIDGVSRCPADQKLRVGLIDVA